MMEYCRCGSIRAYLNDGNRLNEEEIRDVASCVLLSLVYIHNRNITHWVLQQAFHDGIGHKACQSAHFRERCCQTG